MINYNNSIIYKLVSNDINIKEFYIGSTVNFRRRKSQHKHNCNISNAKNYNTKVYQFIRDNGGWHTWTMILVEKTPCNDKIELRKIEREFMEKLCSSLNMCSAYRSKEEQEAYNKEYKKIYNESNKIKIAEYYESNKIKIRENSKEYREINKDKIKEYRKIKITCDICNNEILKKNIRQHQKSKKCMNHKIISSESQ